MGDRFLGLLGQRIVRYLETPSPGYEPFTASDPAALSNCLQPGDVLLVEGNSRVAGVIKYLTQSTWSHSALYVGDRLGSKTEDGEPHVLVEAMLGEGVISAPLSKYAIYHTRVCRPLGLTEYDRDTVVSYMIERLGCDYDVKNILDLIRYLVPMPIPARLRRRMIALGSGDPTKAICSTLIAQAFEQVRYPILPKIELIESRETRREILHIRHHSLYTPRDFDISPFFEVVKPTIRAGFDYKKMRWAHLPKRPRPEPRPDPRQPADAKSPPTAPELPAAAKESAVEAMLRT
ncbi:MAG: lipo-like protein [Bradyrhizobiaceae bacterium]|nr:lipo-like protein [Bradyrhizobiaceae bacterium]